MCEVPYRWLGGKGLKGLWTVIQALVAYAKRDRMNEEYSRSVDYTLSHFLVAEND